MPRDYDRLKREANRIADEKARRIAEQIATALFTAGDGTKADRLELRVGTPIAAERGWGGLCFGAVVDRIEEHLKRVL
jgi:hypothetical protein